MEFALVIYFIGLIENLDSKSAFLFLLLGGLACFLYCMFKASYYEGREGTSSQQDNEDFMKDISKFIKKVFTVWCVFVIIVFLTPDKETSYAMLAAYGVQKTGEFVVESEEVKDIAGKSLEVLNKYMDDYLESVEEGETNE